MDSEDNNLMSRAFTELLQNVSAKDDFTVFFQADELLERKCMKNQSIRIQNIPENRIVKVEGLENILGIPNEEYSFEKFIAAIHPDDIVKYIEVVRESFLLLLGTKDVEPFNSQLSLNYRLKHKDGYYQHVLQQSTVLSCNKHGEVIELFHITTEIDSLPFNGVTASLLYTSNKKTDFVVLNSNVGYQPYTLTNRELDVLKLINKGLSSKQIAENLSISKYTVDTHRKNMLSKTKVSNTYELVNLARISGLV